MTKNLAEETLLTFDKKMKDLLDRTHSKLTVMKNKR